MKLWYHGEQTQLRNPSRGTILCTLSLFHTFYGAQEKVPRPWQSTLFVSAKGFFRNKSILRRRARYWHQSHQTSSHVNISKVSSHVNISKVISQNWLRILKRMVDFQWHPLHKILLENFPTEFPRSCISNLQRKHSIRVQGTFRNRSIIIVTGSKFSEPIEIEYVNQY